MITRFHRCVGFRLLRLLRWQVELWCCPAGEIIPPHVHSQFDGRLVFLGGSMRWTLGDRVRDLSWSDFGKSWSVPVGTVHGARVLGRFGIFLNIERWSGEPTSAAEDFIATP